jgi:N6-L-threonylcarbamoyladenine synthase
MRPSNNLTILAIDTSCDDTCIAIVEADLRGSKRGLTQINLHIKSNIVSSQVKLHAKYGGVYPTLAKREHQKNLPIVLKKALKEASFEISNFQISRLKEARLAQLCWAANFKQTPDIDLIAVTVGPGLEPCLWTGVNFAEDLARIWEKPIIPVNHIEAHIAANFIGGNSKSKILNPKQILNSKFQNSKLFPAICLVVSGGHTQLILMKDIGDYKILGETRDDAAGECFDKCARILGLGYPGGPAIEKQAEKFKVYGLRSKVRLPRPMLYQKNFDFSFSGLKTAVLYDFKNRPPTIKRSKRYIQAMAAEVQQAIIDVLISKTLKAAKEYQAKSIILGGGVAANKDLRKQFKKVCLRWNLKHLVPPKNLCTDNAAMVAIAGYFNYLKGKIKNWENIKVNANLRI